MADRIVKPVGSKPRAVVVCPDGPFYLLKYPDGSIEGALIKREAEWKARRWITNHGDGIIDIRWDFYG